MQRVPEMGRSYDIFRKLNEMCDGFDAGVEEEVR